MVGNKMQRGLKISPSLLLPILDRTLPCGGSLGPRALLPFWLAGWPWGCLSCAGMAAPRQRRGEEERDELGREKALERVLWSFLLRPKREI
jgi:hypothetical protein